MLGVGVEDSEAAWEGEPVSEGGCVAVDEDDAPVEAVSLGDDDALDVMDIDAEPLIDEEMLADRDWLGDADPEFEPDVL